MVPFSPLEVSWTSHDARTVIAETTIGRNARARSSHR